MEPYKHYSDSRSDNQDSQNTWLRGLYMLLFVVAFGIGEALIIFVAIVQFLWLLFAGKYNQNLVKFGLSLSKWIADITRFQTGVTEEKPFPWSEWPN